ncbi:MAG: NAD(P)H-hydrate epimerase [Tetragenococcus sp.]|nr:NAD(P)H-hydrate epimerase [Tetragenococcus sp.]
MKNSLLANDLTIDAILGIGLDREVKGIFKQVIKNINRYSKQTLAVDTPSGLDADSGKVLGVAIQADRTISFHLMKKGLSKSKKHSGEVTVVDIGIPDFVTQMVLENWGIRIIVWKEG